MTSTLLVDEFYRVPRMATRRTSPMEMRRHVHVKGSSPAPSRGKTFEAAAAIESTIAYVRFCMKRFGSSGRTEARWPYCGLTRGVLVLSAGHFGTHGAEMLGDRKEKRRLLRWGIALVLKVGGVVARKTALGAGAERAVNLWLEEVYEDGWEAKPAAASGGNQSDPDMLHARRPAGLVRQGFRSSCRPTRHELILGSDGGARFGRMCIKPVQYPQESARTCSL
ncbi:hypothetical protein BD309DRAFT_949622 [Dichomitus squalens]|uniref:Uncharacterized protein n=1 Tax=Dichomitus squalens TaxID=114155 RepID=A0A4Q9P373_9APHY|nr:hypothetical protein BD309DRAFT_949622 [Dichomitus squalens]TBU58721.1 hypothetical protein BD310DRAFT_926402 [Dichomitus squalens]